MEQHFLNGFGITTESWYLTYDQLAREYHLVDHTGTVWNAWESYLAMYLQLMQWSFIGDTAAKTALELIEEVGKNYP
jgi:hypothetical protein